MSNPPGPVPAGLAGLAGRHLASGKVRELYDAGDGLVLIVATDRISAFDHVLPTPIPDKGVVLTAMTRWWLDQLDDLVGTHLVSTDVADLPPPLAPFAAELAGRSMLCRRLSMLPVECVARGYLAGSGLADYRAGGAVCGVPLPAGLQDGSRLPEPIFTPATKAERGAHDENVTEAEVAAALGPDVVAALRRLTLAVYRRAADVAADRGILLADTKLEFGHDDVGRLVLGDEVLTPDSSRFWPADRWRPGRPQPSFDKQYVRDWLTGESGWDRHGPPPALPEQVVARTRGRYLEAYRRLTGRELVGVEENP